MADSLDNTEIGFNAEDAIKELRRLELGTTTFTKAVEALTVSTKAYNVQGLKLEDLMRNWTEAIRETRQEMERLASAQRKASGEAEAKRVAAATRRQQRKLAEVRQTLRDNLLPDRDSQNLDKLLKFDKAFDSIEKLSKRFGTSADRIKAILGDLRAEYKGAERQIRDSLVAMLRDNDKTARALADPKRGLAQANQVRKRFAGAEAIKSLGVVSLKETVDFQKAGASLEKLLTKHKITQKQLDGILNNMSANWRGTEREVRDAIERYIRMLNKLGSAHERTKRQTSKPVVGNPVGPTAGANARAALGNAGRTALGVFGGGLALDAVGEASQAFRKSFQEARDLQIAFARIRTIAPPDLANNEQVRQRTSVISNDLGIDQLKVAEAAYDTFSNQVGNTAESFAFLRKAGQFAKATITEYADSVDLLSGVLNAYNLRQSETNRIADQLFKTIDVGRIKGEQIANILGNTIPLANQLGIKTEEIFGSAAALTIQGVSPDDALTQLRNVIQKLINPSEALQKVLDKMGITSVEAGVRGHGFVEFLQLIQSETDGSIEEINKLFNEMRAGRGIASLNAQDGRLVANAIREIGEASEGASEKAAKLIQETGAEQLARNLAALRNELTADVGDSLITAVNDLFSVLGGAQGAALGTEAAIGALGTASVVAGTAMTINLIASTVESVKAFKEFGAASKLASLSLAGFGILAGGITLAVIIHEFTKAEDQLKKFQTALEVVTRDYDRLIDQSVRAQQKTSQEQIKVVEANTKFLVQNLQDQTKTFLDLENQFKDTQTEVTQNLKTQVSSRVDALDKLVDKLDEVGRESKKRIFDLGTNRLNFELDASSAKFDLFSNNLNDRQQVVALQARINELLSKVKINNRTGDFGFSERLLSEAQNLAQRLGGINGQELSAAREIDKILAERRNINATLIAQEEAKARAAEAAKAQIVEQQREIKKNIVEYNRLLGELNKTDLTAPNRDKKESELNKLGATINQQLTNFDGAGLDAVTQFAKLQEGQTDEIGQLLSEIRKPFTGLDGLPVKLENAILQGFEKIRESLTGAGFAGPAEKRIQELLGTDSAGATLLKEANKRVVDLAEQIGNGEANRSNVVFQGGELLRQKDLLNKAGLGADASFRVRAAQSEGVSKTPFGAIFNALGFDRNLQDASNLRNVASTVEGFRTSASSAIDSGNLQKLQQTETQLSRFISLLQQTTEGNAEKEINLLQQMQSALSASIQTIQELNKAKENAALTDANIEEQRLLREAIELNTAALRERDKFLLENAVTPIPGSSLGRFLPQGRDKYMGAYDPGESIINADSTRRFYSDLRAINAGIRPQQQSSTSFGDITINVNTNSPVDGATLARELRRHLRKGL